MSGAVASQGDWVQNGMKKLERSRWLFFDGQSAKLVTPRLGEATVTQEQTERRLEADRGEA
jgi:hypothetical protein